MIWKLLGLFAVFLFVFGAFYSTYKWGETKEKQSQAEIEKEAHEVRDDVEDNIIKLDDYAVRVRLSRWAVQADPSDTK